MNDGATAKVLDPAVIAAEEKAKYERVWKDPDYRVKCHGLDLWLDHRALCPPEPKRALDIGCGLGRLFAHWNDTGIAGWGVDHTVTALDPAIHARYGDRFVEACLWEMDLQGFDFGLCADVMEHIPREVVPETLARIGRACRQVLFAIAYNNSVWHGVNLHLTVEPAHWWLLEISRHGGTVEHVERAKVGRHVHVIRWYPQGWRT